MVCVTATHLVQGGVVPHTVTNEQLMDVLAIHAEELRPRLFAIYGVVKPINGITDEQPYIGWGLDLGDGQGALYWEAPDSSTHISDSAERILSFHERAGAARLIWFDR
jgi:hypothetical protein